MDKVFFDLELIHVRLDGKDRHALGTYVATRRDGRRYR